MSHWRLLLDRLITGFAQLKQNHQPVPDWVLGGGTALMLQTDHRLSKDIDVFICDPQYLSYLSPELAGEGVWGCEAFDSAAHYLKLIYKEGEIDFIVAPSMTGIPNIRRDVEGHVIMLEHPVEIALKKMHYRGAQLKVRDVFDIAVVDHEFPDLLADKLVLIAAKKDAILARLAAMTL